MYFRFLLLSWFTIYVFYKNVQKYSVAKWSFLIHSPLTFWSKILIHLSNVCFRKYFIVKEYLQNWISNEPSSVRNRTLWGTVEPVVELSKLSQFGFVLSVPRPQYRFASLHAVVHRVALFSTLEAVFFISTFFWLPLFFSRHRPSSYIFQK